jgi:hypothetical protein
MPVMRGQLKPSSRLFLFSMWARSSDMRTALEVGAPHVTGEASTVRLFGRRNPVVYTKLVDLFQVLFLV